MKANQNIKKIVNQKISHINQQKQLQLLLKDQSAHLLVVQQLILNSPALTSVSLLE